MASLIRRVESPIHGVERSFLPQTAAPVSAPANYGQAAGSFMYNLLSSTQAIATSYKQAKPMGSSSGGLTSKNIWDGPFLNYRVNMGGQQEIISKSDPRHTSWAYADRHPDAFAAYQSGTLSATGLWNSAMYDNVYNDRDELGNSVRFITYNARNNQTGFRYSGFGGSGSTWSPTNPAKVKVNFNSSGGGSITGAGSWGGLTGTWTGSSRSPFNFGW